MKMRISTLVSEIVNMSDKDLETLAKTISWYSVGVDKRSERLEFLLAAANRENNVKMENMESVK